MREPVTWGEIVAEETDVEKVEDLEKKVVSVKESNHDG